MIVNSHVRTGTWLNESLIPKFWSHGGDNVEVPEIFTAAVVAATKGTSCIGCSHAHFSEIAEEVVVSAHGTAN